MHTSNLSVTEYVINKINTHYKLNTIFKIFEFSARFLVQLFTKKQKGDCERSKWERSTS